MPWYLDAVTASGAWDVAIVQHDFNTLGIWPYFINKKYGIHYCTQPHLTPYLGPIIFYGKQELKTSTKIGRDKKILNQLVDQLPNTILFVCQGMPSWENWQPLNWRGFRQTTKYTSRLDLKKGLDDLKKGLSDKNRNQILLAETKVKISYKCSPEEIYNLTQKSFDRQGLKVPYSPIFLKSFFDVLEQNKSIFTVAASVDGHVIGSVLVASDKDTSYLLSTGRDVEAPPGTISLLIWKSILEAKKQQKEIYDFEGSMIQNIESFFRSFGGEQTPYHKVYRTRNKLSRILLDVFNRL